MKKSRKSKEPDKDIQESIKETLRNLVKKKKEEIYKDNEFTDWFENMIIKNDLLDYFEKNLPEFSFYRFNQKRECIFSVLKRKSLDVWESSFSSLSNCLYFCF